MSNLLRIVGSILALYGVINIIVISFSYTPYDAHTIIQFLFLQTPGFLLFILPGLALLSVGAAAAKREEQRQSDQKSNKTLEIGAIIAKSFLLAVGIFLLIFLLSLFLPGNNLGPIVGVAYGSIASLGFFVLFSVAWILRDRGFTRKRAYSTALAVICLIPLVFVFIVMFYKINR
jgi:hypothetical protein